MKELKETTRQIQLKAKIGKLNAEMKKRQKAAMLHTGELFHRVNPELVIKRATWMYPYSSDELKHYHQVIGLIVKFQELRNKSNTKKLDKLEQLGVEFLQSLKATTAQDKII